MLGHANEVAPVLSPRALLTGYRHLHGLNCSTKQEKTALLGRSCIFSNFSRAFLPIECPLVLQAMEEEKNFRALQEMLGEADGPASATHSA